MNKALKAALLSGLVFPGVGHFLLKRYKRGAVFIVAVSAGLLAIIIKALQKAFIILEKIELDGGAINMNAMSKAATQATTSSDSLTYNFLLLFIILCWIIGIVDAYRIGRKIDIESRLEIHK